MHVENQTIVVTGASSGIGAAGAKMLAARGARVCLVARREDELRRVADEIDANGCRAWIYPTDLTDEAAVARCVETIQAEHPRVDVLINNAGRSIRRPVREAFDRLHDYRRTMEINYFAAVQLTLAFLPGMLERNHGQIVNVSSFATLAPVPRFSAYVGSKAALEGFSQSLAAELSGTGVAVTVLCYPLVRTAMTAPTKMYERMPMMSPVEAAEWMVEAVEKRPARIARRSGEALAVAKTAAPALTTAIMARVFNYRAKRLRRQLED